MAVCGRWRGVVPRHLARVPSTPHGASRRHSSAEFLYSTVPTQPPTHTANCYRKTTDGNHRDWSAPRRLSMPRNPKHPARGERKVPVLLQQARLTSKCHRWQAVRPAQRRVRLSEAAPIGPIIGHSDRAASEQKLSSHHTTSSQPLASIDATLHETPAIQKNYRRHAHARGTSRQNRP